MTSCHKNYNITHETNRNLQPRLTYQSISISNHLQITISMKYFVTNTYATSPTPQADVTCASPTFMNELSIKN